MSDPSTTPLPPPPLLSSPHRQPHHHVPLIHGAVASSSTSLAPREYRKGNWTIQETLILITAKKLDDERRLRATACSTATPTATPSSSAARTSGELRWKWVENYCWSHGCLRSQNQCNDKWDNLLRDYKKVRDYESKSQQQSNDNNNNNKHFPSYWSLNKQQRKEQNLPSNMVLDVYQAITEVLHRKQIQRLQQQQQPQSQHAITLVTSSSPLQTPLLPPPPPPPPPPPVTSTPPATSERSESSGTEHSEDDDDGSESKRRKVKNLGSSIMQSASVLARALRSCEEKKEKRHRELIELEQRRIQMEEARNEVHRQGIATLVAAVTNLSGAIQSLINSDQRHG